MKETKLAIGLWIVILTIIVSVFFGRGPNWNIEIWIATTIYSLCIGACATASLFILGSV